MKIKVDSEEFFPVLRRAKTGRHVIDVAPSVWRKYERARNAFLAMSKKLDDAYHEAVYARHAEFVKRTSDGRRPA